MTTKTVNWSDKSSKTGVWYTPEKVLAPVRASFGGQIPLDPCTHASNPTNAKAFFTEEDNGLEQDWGGYGGVFVNPPYGKNTDFHDFISKIHREAEAGIQRLVCLLPCGARFSTNYWQDEILTPHLSAMCFVRQRVAFRDAKGQLCKNNRFDSCFYFYGWDPAEVGKHYSVLGRVLRTELQ